MDDLPFLPAVAATRNRLADLMTSIGQGAGKAVDWLAGGAQAGAEPTLALMQPGAADQPFWPTADSGGRIGAVSSALTSVLNPVHAPAGALGAGPVFGGKAQRVFDGTPQTISNGDRVGVARVSQWGSSPNANIDAVYAATPGGGRAAMEDIIKRADEAGISLGLDAVPMSNPYTYADPMTPEQLRGWYEKFGFNHAGGNRMLRDPKAQQAALDMSPEARAARAAEMGFDPNRTLYHGTNAEAPIDAFRPSEHGHFGQGVYLSEQPGVAEAYGNAIYPVHTRGEMFDARPGFETRLKGADAQELIDAMPARPASEAWKDNRIAAQKRLDENGYIDRETMWNYLAGQVGRDRAQEILKARGFAGIVGIGDGAETVVFDPANIRSRFAAFDPAKANDPNILSGRAGVPAMPQQPQPEDPATAAARNAWVLEHIRRGGT